MNEIVQILDLEYLLDKKINALSNSDKMKVKVALAILYFPKLLVLDLSSY